MSIGDAVSVSEGAVASFPVTLSGASGKQITVQYSTASGTAVSPGDFNSVTSQTVTFSAGEVAKQVQVQTNDDTFDEPDTESFTVTLASPVNASIGDGSGAGGINDNDALPQVTISNAGPVVEGGSLGFTVTLTPASARTVTVNYATANGTAAAPGDYTSVSSSVTFTPGDTSEPITVTTGNDALDEAQETFTVNLASPSFATLGTPSAGTGTIDDNDPAPSVSIAHAATVTEGAQASFDVTLSAPSGQTVTVPYSTANGTAFAPGDFTAASGASVTFAPGDPLTKPILVPTLDDALDEADTEGFTVALGTPTNASLGAQTVGNGVIADNDALPTVSTTGAAAVDEGNPSLFTVSLSAASGRQVTVSYAVTHGTTVAADFSRTADGHADVHRGPDEPTAQPRDGQRHPRRGCVGDVHADAVRADERDARGLQHRRGHDQRQRRPAERDPERCERIRGSGPRRMGRTGSAPARQPRRRPLRRAACTSPWRSPPPAGSR